MQGLTSTSQELKGQCAQGWSSSRICDLPSLSFPKHATNMVHWILSQYQTYQRFGNIGDLILGRIGAGWFFPSYVQDFQLWEDAMLIKVIVILVMLISRLHIELDQLENKAKSRSWQQWSCVFYHFYVLLLKYNLVWAPPSTNNIQSWETYVTNLCTCIVAYTIMHM